MKFRFLLSTLAIITLAPSPALAKDWSSVAMTANQITVRIEGAIQGSGVLVKKKNDIYSILTALHVVKANNKGEEIVAITHDGVTHELEIKDVKRIKGTDMAVINFK